MFACARLNNNPKKVIITEVIWFDESLSENKRGCFIDGLNAHLIREAFLFSARRKYEITQGKGGYFNEVTENNGDGKKGLLAEGLWRKIKKGRVSFVG